MDIAKKFREIRVYTEDNKPSLHKPVLLLFVLSQCYQNQNRLIPFETIDRAFKQIFTSFSLEGKAENSHYPFGKLENDGIWEVTDSKNLKRTSVGHLSKSELLEKNIAGGFSQEVYETLNTDKTLLLSIARDLLDRYFPPDTHPALLSVLKLTGIDNPADLQIAETSAEYIHPHLNSTQHEAGNNVMAAMQNGYIAYLNALHNLSANSANALAESQATNRYFADLYQAFPIVETVRSALQDGDRVVILTGHAGDGKSTIALDVLKHLKNLALDKPLTDPPKEREDITGLPRGPITIIKDMSELSAENRLQWLTEAFRSTGSWMLVSNTGPLLDSLEKLAEQQELLPDWENKVLSLLDKPYAEGALDQHLLTSDFGKDLLIFNLTRLDNVGLAAQVLAKMLNHPAWEDCAGCAALAACPLQLNRRALLQAGSAVQDRVRWVYQRLSQYEQRLTFRQMVAHLALSLTGGMSCNEAQQWVASSSAEGLEKGVEGLAQLLFSESFFGYRNGKPWPEAERLRAVALAKRLTVGGPVSVSYERQLHRSESLDWAELPDDIAVLGKQWRANAVSESAARWRFALRRMLYLFHLPVGEPAKSDYFTDSFLQSPRLRDFDDWHRKQCLTLNASAKNKLHKACLQVLLEYYSGFSVGQFHNYDRLYLTLRRTDRAIAQPTQWVAASIPFDEFELDFVKDQGLLLRYRKGHAVLKLDLPLLDYIQNRDAGKLGGELARIHRAQLETFRAELLKETGKTSSPGEIILLRANINGAVTKHNYFFDSVNNTLEISGD